MIWDIDFSNLNESGICPKLEKFEYDKRQIKNILSLYRGEWFLNLNQGLEWQEFFQKNPSSSLIVDSVTRELTLYGYPPESMAWEYNPRERKGKLSFTVQGKFFEEDINL